MGIIYTVENYRELLRSLLPKGPIWSAEPGTNMYKLLYAFAEEFKNADARSENLANEADPRSTEELISEWENMVGLPDECRDVSGSLQERRANVIARLTRLGNLTKPFFISVALTLGYEIAIKELHPFRVGISYLNERIADPDFQFVWEVTIPDFTEIPFFLGSSALGDFLVEYTGNADIICLFNKLKPAHTNVFFNTP